MLKLKWFYCIISSVSAVCWKWCWWGASVQYTVRHLCFSCQIYCICIANITYPLVHHSVYITPYIYKKHICYICRFTGSVKLKGIIIAGEDDESHPAEIKLWVWGFTVKYAILQSHVDCNTHKKRVFSRVLVLLSRYKNIPQMSFDDTGKEPEQAFRLNRDPRAELEYPTK